MKHTETFVPVYFVDIAPEGDVYPYGALPLHITLFPPVTDTYSVTYGNAVRDVVHPLPAFEVTTADTALFGPVHTEPVRLIEDSLALQSLHCALTSVLALASHDPTYRQPYNPHISVQDREQVPRNMAIHIGGLSVIQATNDGWQVVDKVRLKGNDETTA